MVSYTVNECTGPLSLAASAVALTAVAFLGCYLPARRVIRVEPAMALRS